MNGLPALKLWQAPDIGNIMRNIAVIKGSQLRSRLAQIGETREQKQEVRDIARLNLQKAVGERAKAKEEREVEDWERKKALDNSEIVLSSSQLVLRAAQTSPQDAQKAHDIAIKTLAEIKIDTSDIPEEWGPKAQKFWQETAQEARPLVAWLLAQEERKKGPTKTKKVWDKTTGQYVQKSQAEINKDPDRYGKTEETIIKHAKAGAPKTEVITGRAVAKKEALSKFDVEKGTDWIPEIMKDFKASQEDWDVMQPEAQEKAFQDYVLGAVSGLYKNAKFRRNKKTGEIALWGDGKPLRTWLKKNF